MIFGKKSNNTKKISDKKAKKENYKSYLANPPNTSNLNLDGSSDQSLGNKQYLDYPNNNEDCETKEKNNYNNEFDYNIDTIKNSNNQELEMETNEEIISVDDSDETMDESDI